MPPPPRGQEPFPEDGDLWGCCDALQELQPSPRTLRHSALNVPSAAGATQQMEATHPKVPELEPRGRLAALDGLNDTSLGRFGIICSLAPPP